MAEREDIVKAEKMIGDLSNEMKKFKDARTAFEDTGKVVSSTIDECVKKIGSFHQETADKLKGFLKETKDISSNFLNRTEEIKNKTEQSIVEMAKFTDGLKALSNDLVKELSQINSQSSEVTNQKIQEVGGELKDGLKALSNDLVKELSQINSQSSEVTNQKIQEVGGELKSGIGKNETLLYLLEGKIKTSFWFLVIGIPILLLVVLSRGCFRN